MEFLLIVLALSFVIQLLVLSATEQLSLRLLGAALMEMIPVSGMIYYTAARPDGLLFGWGGNCLLYTSPSPRDPKTSRMPSSA